MQNNQQQQQPQNNLPGCIRCGIAMQPIMILPIRTGGSSGFFSEWGEFSERILNVEVFRCPRCTKLEFFDLDRSLPNY